jgi:hypothetical protein
VRGLKDEDLKLNQTIVSFDKDKVSSEVNFFKIGLDQNKEFSNKEDGKYEQFER